MINMFQPSLGSEELEAVREVFRSNWPGRGPKTNLFEALLADKIDVPRDNVTTASCCTNALFEICNYLQLGPDDEVVMPSLSFVGAANAVKACGAKIRFADVDQSSLNVTIDSLKRAMTKHTKALLLIHYGGVPCEMDELINYCERRNLIIIEDNACSPFSKYRKKNTGALADFGVWSFDSMKILCCGDGSLIYAKHKSQITESESGFTSDNSRWWEFGISGFGNRYIMNDLQSAIGIEQLKKVDSFIQRRREIHDIYLEQLQCAQLKLPPQIGSDKESSYYLFWIRVERRDELASYLRGRGIYVTFKYHALHKLHEYGSSSPCPIADAIAEDCICLPIHQSLTDEDVLYVCRSIKEWLGHSFRRGE
jgi:dTDP-4-amino-4,6-dideoxygalactose transaminase